MFPRGAFGIGARPGLGGAVVPSVCLGSLSAGGRMGGREEDIAFCKEDSYVQGEEGRGARPSARPPAPPPSARRQPVHLQFILQYLLGAKKGKGALASQLVRGGKQFAIFSQRRLWRGIYFVAGEDLPPRAHSEAKMRWGAAAFSAARPSPASFIICRQPAVQLGRGRRDRRGWLEGWKKKRTRNKVHFFLLLLLSFSISRGRRRRRRHRGGGEEATASKNIACSTRPRDVEKKSSTPPFLPSSVFSPFFQPRIKIHLEDS